MAADSVPVSGKTLGVDNDPVKQNGAARSVSESGTAPFSFLILHGPQAVSLLFGKTGVDQLAKSFQCGILILSV